MANLIPVAKAVYLCDDILSDPTRVKPHLIGVLNAIRADRYPYILPKLQVFAKLVDGLGEVRCRVLIHHARTGRVVHQTGDQVLRFADRRQTIYATFRLQELVWPSPGEYLVELYCNGQFVDDATLRLLE